MCESTVWLRHGDGRVEKVAQEILVARREGEYVVLRGLLKDPLRLRAAIEEVDSLKHTITLSAAPAEAPSGPTAAQTEGGPKAAGERSEAP